MLQTDTQPHRTGFGRWVYWLSSSSFVELLRVLAVFGVLYSVYEFLSGAEERRKSSQYQAWQVINSAQGKGGSGGRIDALQDLTRWNVSMSGVFLDHAWLVDVDLKGANLSRLRARHANLTRANLRQADLSHGDLSWAQLAEANLEESILIGAFLDSTMMRQARLVKARLDSAYFRDAHLEGADMSEATLKDADLRRAQLDGAVLRGANLHGARMYRAALRSADLTRSKITRTALVGADLLFADVDSADFTGSDLSRSQLTGLKNWRRIQSLQGANVFGVIAPPGFVTWAKDTMGAVCHTADGRELTALECLPAAMNP